MREKGRKDAAAVAIVGKCLIFCLLTSQWPFLLLSLLIIPPDKDSPTDAFKLCFHKQKTAMHWVETLTDGGKLRQMYRFARNGGGNNEKSLVARECQAVWDGFHAVLNFLSFLLVPPHFVCHTSFLRFLSLTPYPPCLVTSPIRVLMSPSIFYFLLYMAFIFCMSPLTPRLFLYTLSIHIIYHRTTPFCRLLPVICPSS